MVPTNDGQRRPEQPPQEDKHRRPIRFPAMRSVLCAQWARRGGNLLPRTCVMLISFCMPAPWHWTLSGPIHDARNNKVVFQRLSAFKGRCSALSDSMGLRGGQALAGRQAEKGAGSGCRGEGVTQSSRAAGQKLDHDQPTWKAVGAVGSRQTWSVISHPAQDRIFRASRCPMYGTLAILRWRLTRTLSISGTSKPWGGGGCRPRRRRLASEGPIVDKTRLWPASVQHGHIHACRHVCSS